MRRGSRLPADALAQLGCLARVLALLERALNDRADHDHRDEEEKDAEAEERDGLVVRLAGEALTGPAALAEAVGHRRRAQNETDQGGGEGRGGDPLPHRGACYRRNGIMLRRWPTSPAPMIRSSVTSRSQRGHVTNTNTTRSLMQSSSTGSFSRRWSIPRTTATSPRPTGRTATRSTPWSASPSRPSRAV